MNNLLKRLLVAGAVVITCACARPAEAIAPRRLVEVVDLSHPVVSPDGRRVAFRFEQAAIERGTIETVWYVQDMDGASAPRRVADGGFPQHSPSGLSAPPVAAWSPDGHWIYYLAQTDNRIDIWRAAADGSMAEPITRDAADVRNFVFDPDGRTLKYQVGATRAQVREAEQTAYDQGVRIDRSVPVGQGLFRSGFIEGRPATQRLADNEVERVGLLADAPSRWKTIDLTTREARDCAPSEVPPSPPAASLAEAFPDLSTFAVDGHGRVALLTRTGDDTGLRDRPVSRLMLLPNAQSRRAVPCVAALCSEQAITGVLWRPHSDEVLFTVSSADEGRAQSIYRWDTVSGGVFLVVRSRGLLNGGREERSACGASPDALVCIAAEADRPPRLERIDLATGRRDVLFDPNTALATDIAATAPARLLRWTDASGQTFTGQFFPARPVGRPAPLFVNYYSCTGFLRGGTGDEWPLASLAAEGIAALCINFAPIRLDAVERYDQGLSAVRSAVEHLATAGEIDPSRVGMGGLSLGAEVTLWTVMNSDLLAAASVSSPRTSPLGYTLLSLYGDSFFPRLRTYWQLGSPQETPERWRRLSPVFNLDKIQAPILMQLPEQEYLFALEYAIPLMKDNRSELYVFPDEAHFKFQPRHKLAVYERNLDWFKFWLLDEEDPDPAKREQYTRWHRMKARFARGTEAAANPGQR